MIYFVEVVQLVEGELSLSEMKRAVKELAMKSKKQLHPSAYQVIPTYHLPDTILYTTTLESKPFFSKYKLNISLIFTRVV
jgi:hypothetical protein